MVKPLTHEVIKCTITSINYQLPSATTYEMNEKLQTETDEFSIQSELGLKVLEPESLKDTEFSILYFNCDNLIENISWNYLIPMDNFELAVPFAEDHSLIGVQLRAINSYETPKDILEVSDYEPEVYPSSMYKCLCYRQQVFNVHRDRAQLRTNVLGRSQIYQVGRLSAWEAKAESPSNTPMKDTENKTYIENKVFKVENHPSAFNEIERLKMVDTIDAFIRTNTYAQNFVDIVTDDIAPDYLNVIPVELNLYTIRDHLVNQHYRSREMLMNDLKLIETNSREFNGDDNPITKDAKQVHENLKRIFEKTLTYKLRAVSSL